MKRLILIFVALLPYFAVAQSQSQKIVEKAATIKTLSCDFEQSRTSTMLEQAVKSSGKLLFMAPDKMRWQQNTPSDFVMTINGSKAQIKVAETKVQDFNTSSNRLFKELANIIVGGINGSIFSDTKSYTFAYKSVSDGEEVTLVPRSAQVRRYIGSIVITFDKEWLANRIEMIDSNAESTIIVLKNRVLNTDVNSNQFVQQ